MRPGVPCVPRRIGDGGRQAGRLSVNGNGSEISNAQSGIAPRWREQRWNARASIETNLNFHGEDLRLEHELQTVSAERQRARRYRGFSSVLAASALSRAGSSVFAADTRIARGFRLSSSSRVSASLTCPPPPRWLPEGVRKRRPPRSRHHFWGDDPGGRAGCPNATQPEPFTVSAPS
jgi:hypothetical protein